MIYKPEFANQPRTMCSLGATDEDLAERLEVCVRAVCRSPNIHDEFAEALVAGKGRCSRPARAPSLSNIRQRLALASREFSPAERSMASINHIVQHLISRQSIYLP